MLVIDDQQRLSGIFTGRDAVRTLAEGKDAAVITLAQAMTPIQSQSLPIAAQSTRCGR